MGTLNPLAFNGRLVRVIASRFLLFGTLAPLMMSCAHTKTYVEPPASEQMAILQADAPIWLVTLDGEKISYKGSGLSAHKELRISPGRHEVEISQAGYRSVERRNPYGWSGTAPMHFQSTGTIKLPFVAKAGGSYVVFCDEEKARNEDYFVWKVSIKEFQPMK